MEGNPQVEHGYIRIANEIMDALIKYRIPGEQRQVLDLIIRKTYGWNRKEAPISLDEFCEKTGMVKPSVCRAVNWLLDKKMISKKANYETPRYSFNKEYRKWKPLAKKLTLAKKLITVSKKANPTSIKDNNKDIPPISPKKKKRKIQLPTDFELTQDLKKYALDRDILPEKLNELFEAFQDYHIAEASKKADWNRAWYTWVRNAKQFSKWAVGENNDAYRKLRDSVKKSGKLV